MLDVQVKNLYGMAPRRCFFWNRPWEDAFSLFFCENALGTYRTFGALISLSFSTVSTDVRDQSRVTRGVPLFLAIHTKLSRTANIVKTDGVKKQIIDKWNLHH